jgi:hypothetical protein
MGRTNPCFRDPKPLRSKSFRYGSQGSCGPGPALGCVVELRQLRYFLAVAEAGQFSRAARRLHVSAPSLSRQIRGLARERRVLLFEGIPQAAGPTPAGAIPVEPSRVALAEMYRAPADVHVAGTGSPEPLGLPQVLSARRGASW